MHAARTGGTQLHAPTIEHASDEVGIRPGPGDILGLSPLLSKRHPRAGFYDGPYRPGFYLADRERGIVVPQFLHGHPSLLAVAELILGPGRGPSLLYLYYLLSALLVWTVARRLWPGWIAAAFATTTYVSTPIVIWVHRVPLTESFAGLLLLATTLVCLRERDRGCEDGSPNQLLLAASFLATFSWVRGDLWMMFPAIAVCLSLRPRTKNRLANAPMALLAVGTFASFGLHVATVYPYLHDEIRRQLGLAQGLLPNEMLGLGAAGAALWWLGDTIVGRVLATREALRHNLIARARWLLLAIAGGGICMYLHYLRTPGPPFRRLDPAYPLLGPVLLLLALVGTGFAVRQWRPRGRTHEVWLLALLSVACISIVLYARPNLPHATLYYYGRYLVPTLLPVAILMATHTLVCLDSVLRRRKRAWLASASVATLAAASLWFTAGVLVTNPQTRLQEFADAGEATAWLASQIPEDALVIAGGEGWHHTHTFNQVGGALAVGYGREVLPYSTREAAYAILYEQLIARPRARGTPPRPVFLLVNEATHLTTIDNHRVAAYDDRLPPPFRARRIDLFELIIHRLTPVADRLPVAITRSDLRMVLIEVEVDPGQETETWTFASGKVRGPPGLEVRGATWRHGHLCLDPKRPLELRLPAHPDHFAGSAVLVAAPGSAAQNPHWPIAADHQPWVPRLPKSRVRPRETLGPFVFATRPRVIRIRGSHKPARAPCPHGALAQLRILPPDVHALDEFLTRTHGRIGLHRFSPRDNLGHPYPRTSWVRGISLSRYRAGIRPNPDVEAMSLVLVAGTPLTFAPTFLPVSPPTQVHLRANIKASHVDPDARLVVRINEREVATFDPPDDRDGFWTTPETTTELVEPTARVELELTGKGEIWVRDVALIEALGAENTSPAVPVDLDR